MSFSQPNQDIFKYSTELTQLEGTEHIWSSSLVVCEEKSKTENEIETLKQQSYLARLHIAQHRLLV